MQGGKNWILPKKRDAISSSYVPLWNGKEGAWPWYQLARNEGKNLRLSLFTILYMQKEV
jgi:hypothetical protein